MVENEKLTTKDAWLLEIGDLTKRFCDFNRMDDRWVLGHVNEGRKDINGNVYYRLRYLRSLAGERVKYPLIDAPDDCDNLFIPPNDIVRPGDFIKARVTLASEQIRREYNNPYLTNVDLDSICVLEEIPQWALEQHDGKYFIEQTIQNRYIEEHQPGIDKQIQTLRSDLVDKQREMAEAEILVADATQIISNLEKERDMIVQSNVRLRDMLKVKADWLFNLDLITEDQYFDVLGETDNKPGATTEMLNFNVDLKHKFKDLVTVVQAYLHCEKKLVYPRALLEDFITLLRTHDLIILSGMSGSGKTQLVKSMAEALGGVCKVIAVKPNWTSSEDLLGYYNPLQRSFLKTGFLEALIEASKNQSQLYFICIDEMNLARPEYYFADLLSHMEERNGQPIVPLYSSDESDHTRAALGLFLASINDFEEQFGAGSIKSIQDILRDEGNQSVLKDRFGGEGAQSFLDAHSQLRRRLSSFLDVESSISIPPNVRFIGSVNVDHTTCTLSPKILDRAHVLKFVSPVKYATMDIRAEYETMIGDFPTNKPVYTKPDDLGMREDYPAFDAQHAQCKKILEWSTEYFEHMGIEIAFRTLRQVQHYVSLFKECAVDDEHSDSQAFSNVIRHKILPRFSFDGNVKCVEPGQDLTRTNKVKSWHQEMIQDIRINDRPLECCEELDHVIRMADANNHIFDYWA
ncbi:MAG: AAA family ATPase [Armatimonadota bacterium]